VVVDRYGILNSSERSTRIRGLKMSYFQSIHNIANIICKLEAQAYVYALNGAIAELKEQFPHITPIQITIDITDAIDLARGMSLAGDVFEELDLNAFDV